MSWQSLGPSNVGGCTRQICVDTNGRDRLYLATTGGGCWRFEQKWFRTYAPRAFEYPDGYAWTPLSDSTDFLFMSAVAVAPSDGLVIYAATGIEGDPPHFPCLILRSDDHGYSWKVTSGQDFYMVRKILVHPDDPHTVYVACGYGFFFSQNGGGSWQQIYGAGHVPKFHVPEPDATDAVMDPDFPNIIYIGAREIGVLKTYDAPGPPRTPAETIAPTFRFPISLRSVASYGRLVFQRASEWILQRALDRGPSPHWETVLPWSKATSPTGSMIKIALGMAGGGEHNRTVAVKFASEIFLHRHGGRVSAGEWVSKGAFGGDGQDDWCHAIAVDPSDDNVILVGAQDLHRSADGGATWPQVGGYIHDGGPGDYLNGVHSDQQSIVFDPARPGWVYVANDGGVWRSTDSGQTWEELNRGLVNAEIWQTGISGARATAGMYHVGLIDTTDVKTAQWKPQIRHFPWEFARVFGDPKRLGRFYISADKLYLWQPLESTKLVDCGGFTAISIAVDTAVGSGLVFAATEDRRLMRTTNIDAAKPDWKEEPGVTLPDGTAAMVAAVQIAPNQPGLAYAVSQNGYLFAKTDIHSSSGWTGRGRWTGPGTVFDMAINPVHPDRIYLVMLDALQSYLGRSTDGGKTLTVISGAPPAFSAPEIGFRTIHTHPSDGLTLYLGGASGVYATADEGTSWHRFDSGLPNAIMSQVFTSDGYLYAATRGRGLWRSPL